MPNPNLPNNPGYNLYVGARYVPIFDGEWVATKSYEPLTIVQYLGDSYTSKTFVAAGIAPTDETYWAMTGQYNAQIEDLRGEIANNSADIAENTADITEIKNDISGINASISEIQTKNQQQDASIQENANDITAVDGRTQANTTAIGNINTSISQINNKLTIHTNQLSKKVIIITDSYGTNVGGSEKSFIEIISEILPGVITHAEGGASFTNGRFLGQLQELTVENKEEIHDIYICGGWNDSPLHEGTTAEVIANGIAQAGAYITNNYPNATAHILFIANGTDFDLITGLTQTLRYYQAFGGNYKFGVTATPSYSLGDRAFFADDSIHPSSEGQRRLAYSVLSIIKGGDGNVQTQGQGVMTFGNGYGGSITTDEIRYGESVAIAPTVTAYNLTGPADVLADGTGVDVGTYIMKCWHSWTQRTAITAIIHCNDYHGPVILNFYQGKIYLIKPLLTNESGTLHLNLSNFQLIVPTWNYCGI